MKAFLTLSLTSLLLLGALAPAQAKPASPPRVGFKELTLMYGGIEKSLEDLTSSNPEGVALLLPAVQKIREAASRVQDSCGDREGIVDLSCATAELASQILASDDGKDPALSLLDLYMIGTGETYKKATQALRKSGGDGNPNFGAGDMLVGVQTGLLHESEGQGMPDSVNGLIKEELEFMVETFPRKGNK
ncbi:MAG: hypothetical protein ABI743_09645 [bacterium]